MISDAHVADQLRMGNPADRAICKPCSEGSDCAQSGTCLEVLSAKKGFWRPTATSEEFLDCAEAYRGTNANALARIELAVIN